MIDPIADLLARIRNATMARKSEVTLPYSRMKESILTIMKNEGFLDDLKVLDQDGKKNLLVVISSAKKPTHLRQISKQGHKNYIKKKDIRIPLRGFGLLILSTPKGMITGREAIKQGLGGELICEIW